MVSMRTEEIKNNLLNLGTENDVMYTNDEKLKRLTMLQSAMSHSVFEMSHAEHFVAKDIMKHFEALAKEYNLSSTEEFIRLSDNMDHLSHTIAILKSGQKAEKDTQKMFRLLDLDENIEILYNIGLHNETDQTEIDTIVIAPYGIFLIEIKNFKKDMTLNKNGVFETTDGQDAYYNLGIKMIAKEYLVRQTISDDNSLPIIPILLYSNDQSSLTDNYGQCHISYSGTIVNDIRSHSNSDIKLSKSEINNIKAKLLESNRPTTGLCNVNCNQIVEDFAFLIAEIEDAADNVGDSNNKEIQHINLDDDNTNSSSNWKDRLCDVLDIAVPSCLAGFATYYFLTKKL